MHAGYELKPLGDAIDFLNGKSIKPGGVGSYPVYGSNGIIGGSDDYRFENAIIIGRVGAYCGSIAYCPSKFWASDNTIVAVPKDTTGDVRFFAYLLKHLELNRYAGGAAQPLVTQTVLKKVETLIPNSQLQRKISAILSNYDHLIESNTRRIQILEEMARRIYEEWFVRFRYQGHENVRRVESELGLIPNGWNVKPMAEIADVIDCLHSKKPLESKEGTKILLQLFNISDGGILDLSKKFFVSDEDYELWASRIELAQGDCVITNVGRVGAVAQIPKGVNAALGRNMTGVRPKAGKLTKGYLIQYLLSPYKENEVQRKKDAGAIMDSLNVKGIVRLSVPTPPFQLMQAFDSIVSPIRDRIDVMMLQNDNLRRTRDLLIPKLIAGEIDVSNFSEPLSYSP